MSLDCTPLRNALQRLREGLARHQAEPEDELLRDGLLQRFKFTCEVSRQVLRQRGAASPRSVWQQFSRLRRRSDDALDARSASEIITELPTFIAEVDRLIAADHSHLEA